MNRKSNLALPLFVIFLIIILFLLFSKSGSNTETPTAIQGSPEVFVNPIPESFRGYSQIVNDDHFIYMLPDDQKGLIEVYDLEGKYLKSIKVYDADENGAMKIAVAGNTLYICDKYANLYLFDNGIFTSYIPYYKNKELRKSIDFEVNSTEYYQKNGSLWKGVGDERVCILEGTISSSQILIYWILRIICMGALVALIIAQKNRKT